MQATFVVGRPTTRVFALGALALSLFPLPALAAVCPFDTGGSAAINDGLVLTRYALGITGEKQYRMRRLCPRHEWR